MLKNHINKENLHHAYLIKGDKNTVSEISNFLKEELSFNILNNPDFQNDASISVYPNPTNGIVTVNCNNSIKSIELYDVQGRLLQTNLVNENETTIDVSTKAKGVYFLKILSDKGIGVQKIVRE